MNVQPKRYTYYRWSYAGSSVYAPATSVALVLKP